MIYQLVVLTLSVSAGYLPETYDAQIQPTVFIAEPTTTECTEEKTAFIAEPTTTECTEENTAFIVEPTTTECTGESTGVTTNESIESGVESGAESGVESGVESGAESGAESGVESGVESGAESGVESGVETGVETGVESEFPDTGYASESIPDYGYSETEPTDSEIEVPYDDIETSVESTTETTDEPYSQESGIYDDIFAAGSLGIFQHLILAIPFLAL